MGIGRKGWMAVALVLAGTAGLQAQIHEGRTLVEARLLADSETVVPGRPIMLGLYLRMAPGWHTYWEYSGDAGLPTTIDLDLPDGFRTTPIQWPLPLRLPEPGGLEVYSYKEEVLLLMRLFPPAQLEDEKITLSGSAEWLVCEAFCLPGEADLSLTLEVGDNIVPANEELFDRFASQLPQPLLNRPEDPVKLEWEREGRDLLLKVEGPGDWTYDFYPLPPDDVVLGHPETLEREGGEGAVIRIPLTGAPSDLDRLRGVLVAEEESSGKRQSWRVSRL